MAPLPDGEPAPADGRLPAAALDGAGTRAFGVYVHVPFCAARCGYCDFTTYTPGELGRDASHEQYLDAALAELRLAAAVLGDAGRPAATVFVGGGTPSVLGPALLRLLDGIRQTFGLSPGAEVTVEANPESTDRALLDALRAGGVTRMSFGMQSAVAHVLRTLDRVHAPGRAAACVADAHAAGFAHVNLDVIYGTPGESDGDWARTLDAVLAAGPDHVSAYALGIEPGTRLGRDVRRGLVEPTDDDVLAARYERADEVLGAAGYDWYEVSNWATGTDARCRHNLGYWTGADWWGIGPGAHSHVGGVRWWNVRHPGEYAHRLSAGRSPAAGREVLAEGDRSLERVLLGVRLAEGLPVDELPAAGRGALPAVVADGLAEPAALADGRVRLTRRGRLLADGVVRRLTG